MVRRCHDEEGSQIVQAAFAVPLLIVFMLTSLQLAYMAVSESVLSAQINRACATVDVALLEGRDKDAALETLIASYTMLDESGLEVRNATVQYPPSGRNASSVSGGGLNSVSKQAQYAIVEADITYKIPSMVNAFGLNELRIGRHVSFTQTVEAKVEVK